MVDRTGLGNKAKKKTDFTKDYRIVVQSHEDTEGDVSQSLVDYQQNYSEDWTY